MTVGIHDIDGYVGRASLDVGLLFDARGLDRGRLTNLMMRRKSVNLPCEDPVTNGVNAALPLLKRMSPAEIDDIELIVVGTESGLDFGKPISTYIHDLLELPRRCRSFEVKHACYGATAALQAAAALVATSANPHARALVISTDAASRIDVDSYWEPSQGAGAIAMLVGHDPAILEIDLGRSGLFTFHVMDTLRPRPEIESGNSDLSLLSYLTCLDETYAMYCERNPGTTLDSFDRMVFHTPFAGMVVGAHRTLTRKHGRRSRDEVARHFRDAVADSLVLAQEVGNTYSASLYLALSSMLVHGKVEAGQRIGLFSYGSGCCSEFYSGTLRSKAADAPGPIAMNAAIGQRRELDMATYELISELAEQRFSGVEHADVTIEPYRDLYEECLAGTGLAVLDSIKDFERHYRFA
ncbi:hydroxymethylglutaryl-CoA synthase family protein [Nocardia sp. XZ_19_369]|uniref:hydroxymethylglutaryl-CoA synthase family protein n=1 Tax=Nocardia sp. XZ_19_369 TaxID=2769487 RepID=UPI00188F2877|nr:hydroxymethylglutaryl-CoA synthase family protein [Nocardia sp. XZ_19_369]